MKLKLLWTFLVLFGGSLAYIHNNPLKDPKICGRPTCKRENSKFQYKLATKHHYNYQVNVSSLFEGTSKNESNLFIEAEVELEFISQCDGLLVINNAWLGRKPNGEDMYEDYGEPQEEEEGEIPQSITDSFAEALTEYNLRFSYHDGIITELCPNAEEKNWVLNFKRGILSLLHNSMKRFDLDHESTEEDVNGRCLTFYNVEGVKETSLLLTKTKDFSTCQSRSKLHSMVQTTPYQFRPNYQSMDLIDSKSKCNISIDHHIYNEVSCEERHLFRPFSSKAAGATTIVRQRLKLLNEEQSQQVLEGEEIESRTNLFFDQVPTAKPTIEELRTSRDLIKKLCKMTTDDVQMDFSDVFTTFIHTARILNVPSLQVLYQHSSTICPTGRKHILDALPNLGSDASVALMKNIILKKEVPESTISEWMVAIALIPWPSSHMMDSVQELLSDRIYNASVALGVGSLAYTYCRQHVHCEYETHIDGIISLLETRIQQAYRSEPEERKLRENEEAMLVSLKSLANIGIASEEIKAVLKEMIEDSALETAVRIAAVDVHRRHPCEESRPFFESVFKNISEETEVRIASYLQVMRCPNYVVLRGIIHTLEIEEVNQVGSFVWSHLNNLLKSSVPSRVEIQGLLSEKDLKKKFNSDVRKFSNNFEGSIFFEEYDVGANYDSNVIFSPSSYIPKSAMFNVTVELFGESVNLLEVYGRFEGFEHYLEGLFGPKRDYSSKNLHDSLRIPKMRWSRSIHDNEVLEKEIEELPNIPKQSIVDPKVAMGLKIFGNELKYLSWKGTKEINEGLQTLNPKDYLAKILSGKEINYNKAAMFLDCTYVVPTGAGLPLSLNAIGTSSINMQMYGELHANNYVTTKQFNIKGHLKPSVAIDIVGTMSVDAYFASTGIKLKTNMYTSSAVESDVTIRGTELVKVQFSLPKQNTEIFGAKSELIVMKGLEEEIQHGRAPERINREVCTWPSVENTIGLALCGGYYFPNVTKDETSPYFILAGPSGTKISIRKLDPTAKTYVAEYKWERTTTGSIATLNFDTPGSKLRRLFSANVTTDQYTKNFTLAIQSTAGTVEAHGKYKNTPQERYLKFELITNNQSNFETELSLSLKGIKNGIIYSPKFSLGINAEAVASLDGELKQVTKGSVTQYDVNLRFKTKRLTSDLFGYVVKTEASLGADLKLEYKFKNTVKQNLSLYFLLANRSRNKMVTIFGNCRVEATAYPNVNFNATMTIKKSDDHTEANFNLISSPHLKERIPNDVKKITLDLTMSYRGTVNATRIGLKTSLTRPISNLDLAANVELAMVAHDINVLTSIKYAKDKEIVIVGFYSHPRQSLEYVEGKISVKIPGLSHNLELRGKLGEQSYKNYLIDGSAMWFSGHKIEFKGIYQDKDVVKARNRNLKLLLKSPSFQEINAAIQYYRDDNEFKIDVKADQNKENYGLSLRNFIASPLEMSSLIKLKYNTKIYSLSSSVSLRDKREISIELHLDEVRDVHLAFWAHNKPGDLGAGLELKWDANRDPNQKLMVTIDLTKPGPYHYNADVMISYPGRNIQGVYDFAIREGRFSTMGRLSWAVDQAFAIQLNLDYSFKPETVIEGRLDLITPFEEAKWNSIMLTYHNNANMYNVTGSIAWQRNHKISVDVFGDYALTEDFLTCELKAGVSSTIPDVPTISTSIKHYHNNTKIDSNLKITYKPKQVVAITSSWQIDEDYVGKNYTGTVTIFTPVKGLNRGLLVSKVYVTKNRDIKGIADFDLDHRKFQASVEAHLKKLSNSMLVFNITTPIEQFAKINGRFGFSEIEKHAVAMIQYPKGKIGIEILLQVNSITNFNTKFELATPIEFLQEILLIGKWYPEEVDFKVGWNKLLAGFSGIWRYRDLTNFEYSYKLYTPLDGLEENGLVVKLILEDGVDSELSVILAETRAGVRLYGKNKPRILKEMGINAQNIYLEKLSNPAVLETEKEVEDTASEEVDDDDEENDPISWSGVIVVDAIIYPTITGEIEIEEKGNIYVILGTLTLPDGKAYLKNEFDMIDIYTMKNSLFISTPYHEIKQVTSEFILELVMNEMYLFELDFNYQNRSRWVSTGTKLFFVMDDNEQFSFYNATAHLHTPLPDFPRLDVRGSLRYDNMSYGADFYMMTLKSNISFVGFLQMPEHQFRTDVGFHVHSPALTFPPIRLDFNKDFSTEDKNLNLTLEILEVNATRYHAESTWRYESVQNFKVKFEMDTPLKGLERTEIGGQVSAKERNILVKGKLIFNPIYIKLNSTIIDNEVNATVVYEYGQKRKDITLKGRVITVDRDRHDFKGELITEQISYDVQGNIKTEENIPIDMNFDVRPKKGGNPILVIYSFLKQPRGHSVKCQIRQGHSYATMELHTTLVHELDWEVKLLVDSNHPQYSGFSFHSKAEVIDGFNHTISFSGRTPIEKFERPSITASYILIRDEKQVQIMYDVAETQADLKTSWTWIMKEKMKVEIDGIYNAPNYYRKAAVKAFYVNPEELFTEIKLGGKLILNDTWLMGGNVTVHKDGEHKIKVIGNVDVPHPNQDTHTILGEFEGQNDLTHIIYLGQYTSLATKLKYKSAGDISFTDKNKITGNVDAEWNDKYIKTDASFVTENNVTNVNFKLKTPKFKEDTLITKIQYQPWRLYHNISCEIFYPASRQLGKGDINFKEFSNMNGKVNITTPFRGVNYTHVHFIAETTALIHDRYIKITWPKNNAFLNSTRRTTMGKTYLQRDTKGLIIAELPLQSRHKAIVDYKYSEIPQEIKGEATVKYNGQQLIDGNYISLMESRAGFEKNTIHLEVENPLMPIGANFIHGFSYSSPGGGSNLPTTDSKYLNLYHLKNKTALDVTGTLNITTMENGQAIALSALHSNRTIKLWTNYDVENQTLKHHSKLELGPKAWFAYDLKLVNDTNDDSFEAQHVQLDMYYPKRNFTVKGSYNISELTVNSDLTLKYHNEHERTVQAQFDWRRFEDDPNRQELDLLFKHPTFEKDVKFLGVYSPEGRKLVDVGLTVDYSNDPNKLVKLAALLHNNCDDNVFNYTYNILATHHATTLDLDAKGGFFAKTRWYQMKHIADYTRSYQEKNAELSGFIDINENEIEYKKKTELETSYLWAKYNGYFPLYTLNMSAVYKELNASGKYYLNFNEKLIKMHMNTTEDGSNSIHMYGIIPDSRTIIFDIWREYDDSRINDVSYYFKLNHSRLITARLAWRPDLKQDVQGYIRQKGREMYTDILDNMDYWKKYVRAEISESVADIWEDAKPQIQEFLNDFRDISVIESDFDDFKSFINQSYHNNEFYIQDIHRAATYFLDELALRSHIESLPAIVNEIWEVMGESGKKIQKSIMWIIETIKMYYKSTTDFIHGLAQGETLEHLSEAFKNMVEKFDNTIKNLHVSFIKYMEKLWSQSYAFLIDYWQKTLAALEPTFIAFAHHVENFVWKTGKDFLDFLYIRQSEMMESPYFLKFTNFTHDLDRFYKDMTGNETLTNSFKYAKVVYTFLKEKYFAIVPFAGELQQIIAEIVSEVKELRKLPTVNYFLVKIDEFSYKVKWFCDYFGLEEKFQRFVTIVHMKLTDMKQTALEAENKYRDAKTKFFFEPEDGLMYLEQKLPMAWHAFNETPKFQEIPEYRMINDMQNYFSMSTMSFSNFYYTYKPYTDYSNWLPPFKGVAMVAGLEYFITFDRVYYEYQGSCSYLLASDFVDRNFSIAISYKDYGVKVTHELIVLINKTSIHINVFDNHVYYGNEKQTQLPVEIGSTYIYQEADIVTVDSADGFVLQCNMKFKVCMLEVSGWYFGKTTGLWGTLNNEKYDDLLKSNNALASTSDVEKFTSSWQLDKQCVNKPAVSKKQKRVSNTIRNLCENFFSAKVSPFETCFSRVPSGDFLEMCLNSLTKEEACVSAVAYMNLCAYENTPMRIPEQCVRCSLFNGTTVPEGNIVVLEGKDVPKSADIVFIVEAKRCNKEIRKNRNIDAVIEHLHKELASLKLHDNKYGLVLFGGDGVFDSPKSVVMNDAIFTDHHKIPAYFENLPIGNGTSDIYGAIIYATKLVFRPGVSKTFILVPCSHCAESDMKLDHSILNQQLSESDIKLHILMNDDFHISRLNKDKKNLFGVDQSYAYTRKDADKFEGDKNLRKGVKVPKSSLGICAPLALEVNGSVFSAKKLEQTNGVAKKVASVFAKRVAQSAIPSSCKHCECTAHNTGVSYMECFDCDFPMPGIPDFGFSEEEMITLMHDETFDIPFPQLEIE